MERGLLKAERDLFPHLLRWFDTIIHQKLVQEVIGEVTFCEKLEPLPKDHQSVENMSEEVTDKVASMTIEGDQGDKAPPKSDGLYTSDSRGSDESGDGTPKVPYKTILMATRSPKGRRKGQKGRGGR